MTLSDSSSTRTSGSRRPWRSRAVLLTALVAVSLLVYQYRPYVGEARRVILALTAVGFFLAPLSTRPLRLALWLPAVAAVAWGGKMAGAGYGGLPLWLVCSVAGGALAIRAGGRAATYYLPGAENEEGIALQHVIRRNLLAALFVFAIVFVWDGFSPFLRAGLFLVAAMLFLRYLLLQSKFLHLPITPYLSAPEARGFVASQKWPVLTLALLIGATQWPDAWLGMNDTAPLLLTSLLLLVLAGLIFVIALVRLQQAGLWARSLVRRTSFYAGMALAVALAAVFVELVAPGPARRITFTTSCTFVLVLLPFVNSTTRLLSAYPNACFLVAPPVLAVMSAPLTAVNGLGGISSSPAFLFAFAVIMIVYQLLVVVGEQGRGTLYLLASLGVLATIFFSDGAAWTERGGAWKIFLIALGFVLYAIDLLERATRAAARS